MAADIDTLVEQITTTTGLDRVVVRNAIGIIANFVSAEAPAAAVSALFDKLPGARALADAHKAPGGGLFGIFNDLVAAGLPMADIASVTGEFVAFAKANDAEREVSAVVNAIPGLAQFV